MTSSQQTMTSESVRVSTRAFLNDQKSPVTGLVASYGGSSRYAYDSAKRTFEKGPGEYLEKQCFVYDGALAVMAYSILGDFKSAHEILRNFEYNFHYAKGETIGLLNSYRTDAYADGVGLLSMGIDGDRMHAGPNIWVGLAAYRYSMMSGNLQFLPLMLEIIKWVMHRIPHDTLANRTRAGIAMGSGWGPDWKRIFSTEHNIDYFAILNILLKSFEQPEFSDSIKTSALRFDAVSEERNGVFSWLLEKVFDSVDCRFNVGMNEKGVDKVRALDTTTFAMLGIGASWLKTNGIDPETLIRNTEKYLQIPVTIKGETVAGFDFTDAQGHGNQRNSVIWIEGTYQMVLSYREIAAFYQANSDGIRAKSWNQKAFQFILETEHLIELLGADQQIPPYTSAKPLPMEILKTFKEDWEIQRGDNSTAVKSVASAVWRLFAVENFNPMACNSL
jgi:hypothetical protein